MSSSPLDQLVQRAVDAAQRRWIRFALTGYLILFSGLVGERLISAHDTAARRADNAKSRQAIVSTGTAVAVAACNGRYEDRENARALLQAAKAQVAIAIKNGTIPPAQAKVANAFYDARLKATPLLDCRDTLGVISADPDAVVIIPEPKYPPKAG